MYQTMRCVYSVFAVGISAVLRCACGTPAVRLRYVCGTSAVRLQCSGYLQRDSLRYVCSKLVMWQWQWWLSVVDPLSTAVYYSSCCLRLSCVASTVRLRCTCGTSAVRVQYGSCLQRDSLRCIYSRLAVYSRLVAVNWLPAVDQLQQIGCSRLVVVEWLVAVARVNSRATSALTY